MSTYNISTMTKKTILIIALLLVGTAVSAVLFRPNLILSTEEAKEQVLQEGSKFITWNGNQIHYTDEGQGPVVMMIHGYGGSFYNFQAITLQMRDRYRIIRPDLPGMGLSDFKQSDGQIDYFSAYQDFFATLIDSLGIDSMYVMGNSLGGAMTCLVAASFPEKVKGVVLLNSAGYEMEKVIVKGAGPFRWKWFQEVAAKGLPMPIVKYGVEMPFADRSKVDPTEFPIDYAMINRNGVIQHLSNLAGSGQEVDTTMIAKIKAPTLIIWGKEDVIIPAEHAERFKRDIKGSEVKIYSPCGHMPMMEIPDSIVVDFEKFVEKNQQILVKKLSSL